jgi:hypothetical protein
MCSKCYREAEAQQAKEQAVAQKAAEVAAAVMPPPPKPMSTTVATPAPLAPPAPTSSKPEAVKEALSPDAAPAAEARPVQLNTSRCFTCKKKIGLTGFKCRCTYVFCSEHRYSDKHNCDYDYKAANRDALTKANPTVIADKIQRI